MAGDDKAPVLVTGATGFVGGHLAKVLCQRGSRVRALARSTSDTSKLRDLGVELISGDLGDPASLATAVAGVRRVFHIAGRVTDWGTREQFQAANVQGTANLLAACQAAGVERLVSMSSLTVLGLPRDGRIVNEETPYATPHRGDFYSESKRDAELRVREAHGKGGLATTVIRPAAIWGPGDTVIIPRVLRLLRRGVTPYIGDGANLIGLSWVENLVDGTLLAATSPAGAGQVFHITDEEDVTARTAVAGLAQAFKLPLPRLTLPYPVLYATAALVEFAAKAMRLQNPPPMSRYGVRFVANDCRYHSTKARDLLGYKPRVSFQQGVERLALGQA